MIYEIKKQMQTFTLVVGLWIWLIDYYATFAIVPSTDLMQQNNLPCKKEQSIYHVGIKSWFKMVNKMVIESHWAIGKEIAIGPFLEWHPLNKIGCQTGLFYSYTCLVTVDFSVDYNRLLDTNLFSFGHRVMNTIHVLSGNNEGYIAHAGLDHVQFHAISLPLFFQLYPDKSRKLVCYGGPRLILVFPGLKRKQYCPVHIDTAMIKNIFYNTLRLGKDISNYRSLSVCDMQNLAKQGLSEIYRSIFELQTNRAQNQFFSSNMFYWRLCWDFGFEFKGNSGIILGVSGLGFVLGYDCIKA